MTLYVGNLAFTASDRDLKEAFERFGTVVSARIALDRETRRPRGFGFVEMATESEASAAAAALNERELFGRTIVVNESRPRVDRFAGRR